jgi:hypothetical protein
MIVDVNPSEKRSKKKERKKALSQHWPIVIVYRIFKVIKKKFGPLLDP